MAESGNGWIKVRVAQGHLVPGYHACRELDIAAQQCGRQAAVELHAVLDHGDLVVVRAGVGGGIGDGHRDVLAEVIRGCRSEAGQRVHEFLEAGRDISSAWVGDVNGGNGASDCDCCYSAGRHS